MMLLTKLKMAAAFVATAGVVGLSAAAFFAPVRATIEETTVRKPVPAAAAKKPLATKITPLRNDIGDVASLLHINKKICEVDLRPEGPFMVLSVEVEIYKDGQKQKTRLSGPTWEDANLRKGKPIKGLKIALLAADLDYLPLAGALKGRQRVELKTEHVGSTASGSTDVPKELFDFSRVGPSGSFGGEVGSATEAPLFYFAVNQLNRFAFAGTVSELLERNPKSDFLIVYLRVRER